MNYENIEVNYIIDDEIEFMLDNFDELDNYDEDIVDLVNIFIKEVEDEK